MDHRHPFKPDRFYIGGSLEKQTEILADIDRGVRAEIDAMQADLRAYRALTASGHSPLKAGQIVLDAKRGDAWAAGWIKDALAGKRGRS